MNYKYRIIETEHADGSFTYHPEIGRPKIANTKSIMIDYIWSQVDMPTCESLDLAMDEIQKYKRRKALSNKIVYEE